MHTFVGWVDTRLLLTVVVALVAAARQYNLDSAWAVQRARQLGYPFDKEPGQPMVKLLRHVLRRHTGRLGRRHPNAVHYNCNPSETTPVRKHPLVSR